MKIIISDVFNKKYLLKLSKYFSLEDFIEKLKVNQNNIILKYPYFKIKLRIKTVEFRGVVLFQEENYIIPLMIYLKKDKKYGENIIWSKYEKEVLKVQEEVLKDIKEKKYKMF